MNRFFYFEPEVYSYCVGFFEELTGVDGSRSVH